jgi:Flp pilus assembly protein TadD
LSVKSSHDFVLDIDSIGIGNHYKIIPMSEGQILALYYSNLGSEYILSEQYDEAFKYIIKALYLSPEDASIWTNLGVLYRLKGFNDYAEHSHFIALKHDVKNYHTLNNLAFLYKQTGELEKADYFMKQSKDFQEKDPYYRYFKAIKALNDKDYTMALDHIKFSINKNDEESKFYMVQSNIYTALGEIRLASKAIENAHKFEQN